ncbi:MAG TPA: hypothetical protein VGI00_12415 [Streptosporangiaceae bacterium]|jgi:hypothetical protein
MDPGGEQADRAAAHERRGRELARRMADNADDIAVTLDRAADFHEQVAHQPGYPLEQQAAGRAVVERRIAEQERSAARHYRHAIADQDADEADQSAG